MALGSQYVRPVKSDDSNASAGTGTGVYTLASSSTYYVPVSSDLTSRSIMGVHLTSYTSGLILTSVTIETCSHNDDVTNTSSTGGEWLAWNNPAAYVPVTGSGWTSIAGVVASTGSAVGGAAFDLADTGQCRIRLKIVVGGTGGDVRVSVTRKSA